MSSTRHKENLSRVIIRNASTGFVIVTTFNVLLLFGNFSTARSSSLTRRNVYDLLSSMIITLYIDFGGNCFKGGGLEMVEKACSFALLVLILDKGFVGLKMGRFLGCIDFRRILVRCVQN